MPRVAELSRALLALLAVMTAAEAARAADCGTSGRPWVSLSFEEGAWPKGFGEHVLGDLRAGLVDRGIDACAEDQATALTPPLASVRIAAAGTKSVAVTVDVRDALTEKRVSRDVDLRRVPADGRSFALALAIDELVWASWAEIALTKDGRPRHPPKKPPPAAVVRGITDELPGSGRAPELLLRFAGEHYFGGQTHLGGELGTLLPLGRRLTLDLGAGARQGLRVDASDGRVLSSAIGLGMGLRFAALQTRVAELGVSVGAHATVTRFRGAAGAGAEQAELSGLTAHARLGAFTSLHLGGDFYLDAALGGGAPLRALEATDAGRTVTGVSGVELFTTLGLGVGL